MVAGFDVVVEFVVAEGHEEMDPQAEVHGKVENHSTNEFKKQQNGPRSVPRRIQYLARILAIKFPQDIKKTGMGRLQRPGFFKKYFAGNGKEFGLILGGISG